MQDKLLLAKSEPLWNTNRKVLYFISSAVLLLFCLPLLNLNSF